MNDEMIDYHGDVPQCSVRDGRILRYTHNMYHRGLKEYKIISAPDTTILHTKIDNQAKMWKSKWNKQLSQGKADELNNENENVIDSLENLLVSSYRKEHKLDFRKLKDNKEFGEDKPHEPSKYIKLSYPDTPVKNEIGFSLFEKISRKSRERKIQENNDKNQEELKKWETSKKNIDAKNSASNILYERELEKWEIEVNKWKDRKIQYYEKQKKHNDNIDNLKKQYFEKTTPAVKEYCKFVLNESDFPNFFPNKCEIDYIEDTKILIIEYFLPAPEDMPRVKEVNYNK